MSNAPLACVVIVDDSDDHRYLARRALQRAQLMDEIIECHDAESALRELTERSTKSAEQRLSLALVDVNMPRMNGFDMLDKLNERLDSRTWPLPFIIAISSSSGHSQDVQRALSHPLVDAYVVKPPNAAQLREMVETQVSQRHKQLLRP